MAVAALRHRVLYDWVSFHSGTDILIRSKGIVKMFRQTYRHHAGFFVLGSLGWDRISLFRCGACLCAPEPDCLAIEQKVQATVDAGTWQKTSSTFQTGSNWGTISH
jgi:hypothetical protein